MNLLKETIDVLKDNNKNPEDVLWVGDKTLFFTWEHFARIADKEYDDGFGGEEVLTQLLVVGNDWWLERHSYDGSEWWEFKSLPTRPEKQYQLKSVFHEYYEDLERQDFIWRDDNFEEILRKTK